MSCGIRFGILLLISVVAATPGAAIATTIYVDDDATGANDGSSWENAYKFLQDALTRSGYWPKPVEIRVAQGTYRPDQNIYHPDGTGDRQATFQLINAVTVKGGYAGCGKTDPDRRDIEQFEGILTGDLGANDVDINDPCELFTEPTRSENSYHVVTGSGTDATAVLDGFTVTGGNAEGSWPDYSSGGGMINHQGSPTLINCTFIGNTARGWFHEKEWVGDRWGAGMYNSGGRPTLIDCVFQMNSSRYGGGMCNVQSSPTLKNCAFVGNSATVIGGGIYNYFGEYPTSGPTIVNSIFKTNTATSGGGIFADGELVLIDSIVCQNSAIGGIGGGIAGGFQGAITNCKITDNSARDGGGIWACFWPPFEIRNCVISGNSASQAGGGIYGDVGGAIVENCTLTQNCATEGGGVVWDWSDWSDPPVFTNCIFWDNSAITASDILIRNSSRVNVSYTDVQADVNSIYVEPDCQLVWGQGNINADPCLADPDANDFHLLPHSPCINMGDPNFVMESNDVDMDGEKRVMLGRVDMGADEFNPFLAEFVVVRKERVGRTVFEYDCQVVLENISTFAVSNISIEMAEWSENMTIIESSVTFGDAEVGPGGSITSVDTCSFTVDRSEAIDQAEIIWHVTAQLADTGTKMDQTVSSLVPLDPQTSFDGLRDLAENWLWQGSAGGINADSVADGTVNLADFAKFADGWLER